MTHGAGHPSAAPPGRPSGPDLDQVRRWALVLDASGIPNAIEPSGQGGWTLVVDAPHAAQAAAALEAYETENAPARAAPDAPAGTRSWAALAAAIGLVAFHALTVGGSTHEAWIASGAAAGGRIVHGQCWLAVTALTLHADLGHVLSNALALAMFGTAVGLQFGSGLGLWLTLASGVLGNLANAATHPPTHAGVGASTAVFGAVGVLAGAQFARRRWLGRPGSIWAPVVSGVLLFALLGTAEYTDVLAHLWGLVAGIALGMVAGRAVTRPPGRWWQLALELAALSFVAGAWWLARR